MVFSFSNYSSSEVLIVGTAIIFLLIFLSDLFDIPRYIRGDENALACYYSYKAIGGPASWKDTFTEAGGRRQSPINIGTSYAVTICSETLPPLKYSPEYNDCPKEMLLANDGHSVTLTACWKDGAYPAICGGPLTDPFRFLNIRIRWGPNDEEGSEHTINCRRFGLELQATYLRANSKYTSLREALDKNSLLIISYLFEPVRGDNPYLKHITIALKSIHCPYTSVHINPIPLGCITPAFSSQYYMYDGSLTTPPCTEGIVWLVVSEPIGISSKQIAQFRKLCSLDGPIDSNTRPVQDLNNREVFFYE